MTTKTLRKGLNAKGIKAYNPILAGQLSRNEIDECSKNPEKSREISQEKNEDLINFFETLEEDDDLQNIYSNAEFTK